MSLSATALTIDIASIPAELIGYNQWVAWRWEERDGKRTKVPVTVTDEAALFKSDASLLRRASSTDPSTWLSFNHAKAALINDTLAGIGFVVTADDPFCGGDFDKCRNPETGVIDEWALALVHKLNTYTEVTPSGTGLRVWVRAKLPGDRSRKGRVEWYDRARFFTVTGWHLKGTPAIMAAF